MKNKIITTSFIFSALLCQVLSASENEQSNIDASLVPVFYSQPDPEEGQEPSEVKPAEGSDVEYAQAVLKRAIDSGDVEIGSEDEATLAYDRQTNEVFVAVAYLDENGDFAGVFTDRISDGGN